MVTTRDGPCLVCQAPATIADWTPIQEWLSVEDCSCGGFFITKALWSARLVGMRAPEREELAERIRTWRARGDEAWVTAAGNRVTGPLVIASVRPSLHLFPGDPIVGVGDRARWRTRLPSASVA
jgi:hypothetical protein